MAGISQGFGDGRFRMPWWILGALVLKSGTDEVGDGINSYPQAKQVSTVTVANVGDNLDAIITINGVDVTYNTGTGEAAADIGAGLAEAINAEPLVRGQVVATFDTATLTLTAVTPGVVFTVSIASDPSATLSAVTAVTAADSADPIEFGRAIVRTGHQDTDELVAKAASGLFTMQVITAPIAYVSTAVVEVRVYERRGSEKILIAGVSEASATDRDTTVDALVALLNAALPANSVIVTADNATGTALVFTSEVGGLEFDVEVFAGHEGASLPAVSVAYTTGPSEATSFHRAWRGVALRDQATAAETIAGTEQRYLGNACVSFLRKGVIAVESAEAITPGATVYVELGVTADNGKFFATDSATRIGLSRQLARWELDANTATGSLAALRLM